MAKVSVKKSDHQKAFKLVKKVLDELDPEGLLKMGAPKDEYSSEAHSLELALARGERITAAYVRDVWLYWFGCGEEADSGKVHVGKMSMRAVFGTIASRIRTRSASLRRAALPRADDVALTDAQKAVMEDLARNRGFVWTGHGPGTAVVGSARVSTLQALERAGAVRLVTRRPTWVLPSSWQASRECGERLWLLRPSWRERAKEIRDERFADRWSKEPEKQRRRRR